MGMAYNDGAKILDSKKAFITEIFFQTINALSCSVSVAEMRLYFFSFVWLLLGCFLYQGTGSESRGVFLCNEVFYIILLWLKKC